MRIDQIDCSNQNNAILWQFLAKTFKSHPLQSQFWGDLKQKHGWKAHYLVFLKDDAPTCDEIFKTGSIKQNVRPENIASSNVFVENIFENDIIEDYILGGVLLLERKLIKPFGSICHIPRGPFLVNSCDTNTMQKCLNELSKWVKENLNTSAVICEPDIEQDAWQWPGKWKQTKDTILYPHTLILDLNNSQNDLFAAMSKKTRQYINKSSKNPALKLEKILLDKTSVQKILDQIMDIYQSTSKRAGFDIHAKQYYADLINFSDNINSLYLAFLNDKAVAFLWNAKGGETVFELYGGMNEQGAKMRANYGLKWLAILDAQSNGFKRYDFNGLLGEGITKFKTGFANHRNTLVGSGIFICQPLRYYIFNTLLLLFRLMRKILKKS